MSNQHIRIAIQPAAKWFKYYFVPFLLLHFPGIRLVEPGTFPVDCIIDGFNDPTSANVLEYKNNPNYANTRIIIVTGEPYGMDHNFVHLIIDCKRDPNYLPKHVNWIYLPNYVMGFGERFHHPKELLLPAQWDEKDVERLVQTKTKFCAYLYSNPIPFREQFFDLLSKHYQSADALGACKSNKLRGETDRVFNDWMRETFYDTAIKKYEPYKFAIAFENTLVNGYITEKLVNPVLARTIPIYYGAPDIFSDGVFNPKAIIHVRDFPSFEACIEYIKKVDQDINLYKQYLREPLFLNNRLPKYFDSNYLVPKLVEMFAK